MKVGTSFFAIYYYEIVMQSIGFIITPFVVTSLSV